MTFIKKYLRHLQISPNQQKGLFLFSLLMVFLLGFQYGAPFGDFSLHPPLTHTEGAITIELLGAINRPGLYSYKEVPTIRQVIKDGGGIDLPLPPSREAIDQSLEGDISLIVQSDRSGVLFLRKPLSQKAHWILGRPISLNQALPEDLDRLPGIGPGLARRIFDFRQDRGGFTSLEELKEVKGIKEKTFKRIKGFLTL